MIAIPAKRSRFPIRSIVISSIVYFIENSDPCHHFLTV